MQQQSELQLPLNAQCMITIRIVGIENNSKTTVICGGTMKWSMGNVHLCEVSLVQKTLRACSNRSSELEQPRQHISAYCTNLEDNTASQHGLSSSKMGCFVKIANSIT